MFRSVRRKKSERTAEDAAALLIAARRGVLAVNGDNGYPYAVPVNFLYDEDERKIYFHGSHAGHKVDSLRKSDKVCFTVFGNETVKDEAWAPYVQSVVVFGRCRPMDYDAHAAEALKRFAMKYYPSEALADQQIADCGNKVQMFEIEIEHMTAKEVQEK